MPTYNKNSGLTDFNSLASYAPHLVPEWHPENPFSAYEISRGAKRRVKWICSLEHSWIASVYDRTRPKGTSCPFCQNRKTLPGFNDLVTSNPLLVKQWDYKKNDKSPSAYSPQSNQKVWWLCASGHSFYSQIAKRVRSRPNGDGCGVCSGKIFQSGVNDFAFKYPELALEWHPTRNLVSPSEVSAWHKKMVWWLCDCGNEWKCMPPNRVKGAKCPICSPVSKSEVVFRESVSSFITDISEEPNSKVAVLGLKRPIQLDIVGTFRGKKVVVEYDGRRYHEDNIERDTRNTRALISAGYIVVRIRESELTFLKIRNRSFYQVRHRWSLDPKNVDFTTMLIRDWLETNH